MLHIARKYHELIIKAEGDRIPPTPRIGSEIQEARRRAEILLEQSLKILPNHRATYQALMDLFEDTDQTDQVAGVARRLLDIWPDDFETLQYLASHASKSGEPDVALALAIRAREVRPLDRQAIASEWAAHVVLARHHALHGRWDEGRAELATARRLDPALSGRAHFDARVAVFEMKANRSDLAAEIIAEALSQHPESASLRFAMAIEARRFELSPDEIARADTRWATELSGKARAESAGGMAEILDPILIGDVKYSDRDDHVRQVVEYIGRTTRLKYNRDGLNHVCNLLQQMPLQSELLLKLVKRGLKLFPDAPEFPMQMGMLELAKGPLRASVRLARGYLETALKLARPRAATDPRAALLIPEVERLLSGLNELSEGPMGFGGSFGYFDSLEDSMDSPDGVFEMLAGMLGRPSDPEDWPDGDDDDRPAPVPQPKKGKNSKRKR